jgi:hypothetical protein
MHELEQHSDGSTAFVAGHNIDAWHQLGTVLPAGLTAQDVMTYARLGGWDVRKREISTTLISTTLISAAGVTNMIVDGKYVTVPTNPITGAEEVIGQATGQAGIVGDTYKCFQNEQLTDYLLLDQLRRHGRSRCCCQWRPPRSGRNRRSWTCRSPSLPSSAGTG